MAVISLSIYDEADPNGTALATVTDEDVEGFEMRAAENELGAGQIKIRRDHSAVQYLVGGNYVKVTIPVVDADPIFGFWLNEADDTIVGANEEGDEILVRGGPGTLAVLGRAILLEQRYSTAHAFRGGVNVPGFWTWTSEPYGAILVRLIEEGQDEPGAPLADVTIDFNRQEDTNSDAWPDIIESIQMDIGTDGLGLYERLVATGNLFVYPDPDLTIHAYGTAPGVDRSSATFASGKVRFEKGINIETELVRTDEGRPATHALVKGKDLVYRQVVAPSFSGGDRAKWITVDFPESNDPDLLDAVGLREIARQQLISDQPEFAILPGDDESLGRYLPFKHFQLGDIATLHTGSGASDFNELDTRIIGIKVVLREASDDSTDELAARSLDVVIEANGGPTYGGLGRRDPGVNAPNGCAPCPGDFPFVPNAPGHFYAVDFFITGDTFARNPASSAATTTVITADAEYNWHLDIDWFGGKAYAKNVDLLNDIDLGTNSFLINVPNGVQVNDGSYSFDGSFTAPDVTHILNPYRMTGECAQSPHGADILGHVVGWVDPVGWVSAGTPPSAGQMTPPAAPLETPDGSTTVFTVPFTPTRYAPGSLHVEFNGSRLEPGVDFEETDPSAGTFTFLTFTPSANAQIVVWYQQGTP